ncbi:WD40 repeat domain-containing protein [Aliikangiella sp. G2MR2-5]|uniref:WD40 repeat domain-containing protein n=1 Tax=Aliikangiella sp. G2MR2-5 TaxID=2788943 RepID=UPI0018AAF36C|nr:hypothetical protein [Aliikangiella sp. G2MR2-5]
MNNFACRILLTLSVLLFAACEQKTPSIAEWQHAAAGAFDAAISQDGRYSLVASVNFGAAYWDLEKNQLLYQWRHNDNPEDGIVAVDISPDGSRAITADKRTFVIWNTNSGKAYGYWEAPSDIRAVAISNKGRYVLLGLGSGLVIFIDMNTGRRIEFTAHRQEAVASVDLSPNGLWAFTGGNDYRAILWNTQTAKPRLILEHKTRVSQLKLDRKGKLAFTSGTLGNAFIWSVETGKQVSQLKLKPREYVVSSAEFSSDGDLLITGAPGRDISLWQTSSGNRVAKYRARTRVKGRPSGAIIYAVGFTQDGLHILSESSAGYGEKWLIPSVDG